MANIHLSVERVNPGTSCWTRVGFAMLHLSQDPAADQLLSEDPLALLVGFVLDQQIR
jgi:hypothetical protein